jgi:hypothetical protein
MDQTSPDPTPVSSPARDNRVTQRLQNIASGRIVDWTRGWVSREGRLHTLLAARTRDFVVLTDSDLELITTGFFSRHPRRCVFSSKLNETRLTSELIGSGRRLRVTTLDAHQIWAHPIWIELPANDATAAFTSALAARAQSGAR